MFLKRFSLSDSGNQCPIVESQEPCTTKKKQESETPEPKETRRTLHG